MSETQVEMVGGNWLKEPKVRLSQEELDRGISIVMLKRNLDAARLLKDVEGMRWCYRELAKLGK